MKKQRLRGVLLGISLALLLAGGAALAAGLQVTVDQDCFECAPGSDDPDAEHTVVVTADDYSDTEMCGELEINGEVFSPSGECSVPPHEAPCQVWLAVDCPRMELHMMNDCVEAQPPSAGLQEVGPSFTPVEYGDWVVTAWQEQNEEPVGPVREVAFRFAEDCSAVEFVPEPGTIALLGSGLAGLAGYATLRWRARS
jgi:hypothetical protein